jgi:hypothetical protein
MQNERLCPRILPIGSRWAEGHGGFGQRGCTSRKAAFGACQTTATATRNYLRSRSERIAAQFELSRSYAPPKPPWLARAPMSREPCSTRTMTTPPVTGENGAEIRGTERTVGKTGGAERRSTRAMASTAGCPRAGPHRRGNPACPQPQRRPRRFCTGDKRSGRRRRTRKTKFFES